MNDVQEYLHEGVWLAISRCCHPRPVIFVYHKWRQSSLRSITGQVRILRVFFSIKTIRPWRGIPYDGTTIPLPNETSIDWRIESARPFQSLTYHAILP